jgi:uroporphyrinogen III methyltransferase/synthase
MKKNKVYLVGAGPGKSDLITVRGKKILEQADVVIYDYLVDKALLTSVKDDSEIVCCDQLNKGKYLNGLVINNNGINNFLINKVNEGKKVVRLKIGDPSIFGRCSQELDILVKNKIEFEIVPGVTAATAASCLSGIPLTDRRFASSCVFITGYENPEKEISSHDWDSLVNSGTLVLYMAVGNLNEIIEKIQKTGKDKDTPVAVVQDISLLIQKVLISTLDKIIEKAESQQIKPPAIIIVGEVVKLEKEFNWLKKGKNILFTGLSEERYFTESNYFHLPLIKIEPMKDYSEFDTHLKNIQIFDWIIFASRYGVEYFFKRLKTTGYDSRILSEIKIAAIGNSTRNRLSDFSILADVVPKKESSVGLIEKFKKIDIKDKNIFLPRSDISDKGLSRAFEELGAKVTTSLAYKNTIPKELPDLDFNFFDEIVFTSPSTVRNFKQRYKKIPSGLKVSFIGDVTLREAKKCNLLD